MRRQQDATLDGPLRYVLTSFVCFVLRQVELPVPCRRQQRPGLVCYAPSVVAAVLVVWRKGPLSTQLLLSSRCQVLLMPQLLHRVSVMATVSCDSGGVLLW